MANHGKGAQASSTDRSEKYDLTRRLFLGSAATALPIGLAGCTSGDGGEGGATTTSEPSGDGDATTEPTTEGDEPTRGGTLRWGGASNTNSIDPHTTASSAMWRLNVNVLEGLVFMDWDRQIKPDLARDFTVADDESRITFQLQEGVTFHNGKELTSEDVLATYERVYTDETTIAHGEFQRFESFETDGPYTFIANLAEPFAPLLTQIATPSAFILPEEQIEEAEDDLGLPIGTGPFQWEEWNPPDNVELSRFDDYRVEGLPYLDGITKRGLTDDTVRVDTFLAGDVDYINSVPEKDINRITDQEGTRFEPGEPYLVSLLAMNCNQPPFDDKEARLAMAYAIDKEEILEGAVGGRGSIAPSYLHRDSPWASPNIEPRGKDLDRAQEHLDNSEYGPEEFEFTIYVYPGRGNTTKTELIQASINQLDGVNTTVENLTANRWVEQIWNTESWAATAGGINSGLCNVDPWTAYYKVNHAEGGYSFTRWSNDEYLDVVLEAGETFDYEEQRQLYHEADEIFHEEVGGYINIFWSNFNSAATSEYRGRMGGAWTTTLEFEDNWFDR